MPTYKLNYFNARGFAELSRWIFAVAGQDYEDRRFSREEWPKAKSGSPTGQAPWLEVDGEKITQSLVIARYLARTFGLAGGDQLQQAKADMIVGCVNDMRDILTKFFFESDEAKKAEMFTVAVAEKLPGWLSIFERLLVSNKGGDGYFVGDSMTWCDMHFTLVLSYFEQAGVTNLLDAVPKVKALRKRVEGHPKIADWIAKRPKTDR